MTAPDFIWAWGDKRDDRRWSDLDEDALSEDGAYVRRDPAVLAALPEVQAAVAAAVAKALEGVLDEVGYSLDNLTTAIRAMIPEAQP